MAGVQKLFDQYGNCVHESIEKRIRRTAENLLDYMRGSIRGRVVLEEVVPSVSTDWMKYCLTET